MAQAADMRVEVSYHLYRWSLAKELLKLIALTLLVLLELTALVRLWTL